MDFMHRLNNLERFTKDELCDIYVNLCNSQYDRRLGSASTWYKELPERNKRWFHKLTKRKTKEDVLKEYMERIERLTTTYERKRYLYVVVMKIYTDEEFASVWSDIERCEN